MTQQVEAKYVNEWILLNYPDRLYWKRVHLGPLPKKDLARLYKVTQRWIDAVIKDHDKVLLVEAKLVPRPDAVGQLLLYNDLFSQTEMFKELWDWPRQMVLLTTREDRHVRALCEEHNIKYEVYAPPWVLEYLAKRYRR